MTEAPTPQPSRQRPPSASPEYRRAPREVVNYAALRESQADSRAVVHPPAPKPPKQRHDAAPKLAAGKPCRYRKHYCGSEAILTFIAARDGVATVRNAAGREFNEPCAALISLRENE